MENDLLPKEILTFLLHKSLCYSNWHSFEYHSGLIWSWFCNAENPVDLQKKDFSPFNGSLWPSVLFWNMFINVFFILTPNRANTALSTIQYLHEAGHITLKMSRYPNGSWKPNYPLFIWSLYPSPIFCNTFLCIFLFTKSIWDDMQNHKRSQILYSNVWENWHKNTPIFRPLNACCFASRTDRDLILFLLSFWKCQDSKMLTFEKSKMI